MPLIRKDPTAANPPAVAAGLAATSADERWTAARDLAGRPEAVEAMSAALARETDARVREALFSGLARTQSPDAAAAMLPYLRLDDAALRTAALDALRSMPQAAARHTAALLQDADVDVRVLACELARSLPAAEATPVLCMVLDTEPTPNVCACAVEVLAELGEPQALPALARCADRFPDEAFLRFAIRIAAERIGGPARA